MESGREPRLSDPTPITSQGRFRSLVFLAIAIPTLVIGAALVAHTLGAMKPQVHTGEKVDNAAASGMESAPQRRELGQGSPEAIHGEPFAFGDDVNLDALWSKCEEGIMAACDGLFWAAPTDSAYENYGETCGLRDRADGNAVCEERFGKRYDGPAGSQKDSAQARNKAFTYGDNEYFDKLWTQCADGDGTACDKLYWNAPDDSEYEKFGGTCGDRFSAQNRPFKCSAELTEKKE